MKKLILIILLISLNSYAGDLTEGGGGHTSDRLVYDDFIIGGDGSGGGMPVIESELENMEEYFDAKDLLENGIRNFKFEDGSSIYLPRAVSHFERSARF
ncbi:MAG: hypothetical protein DRQ88_11740 [Epsilonproteobacteria bacterium]|nr:MAG: hypothetical protein DRQ88_11740 [Campylobacterota bacterium]